VPAGLDDDGPAAATPETPSAAPVASLVGANVTNTTVKPGESVAAGLGLDSANVIAGVGDGPPRYYLNVENVTGATPSGILTVHIGVKGQAKDAPGSADEFVDSLPLFGLKKASDPDGKHGGNGLSMVLDITDAVASLQRNANAQLEDLEVTLTQPSSGEGTAPISVGRVSVYTAAAEAPDDSEG
jgi:tyrosinase